MGHGQKIRASIFFSRIFFDDGVIWWFNFKFIKNVLGLFAYYTWALMNIMNGRHRNDPNARISTAYSVNTLPMFWDKLSAPSSLLSGNLNLARNVGKELPLYAA